MHSFFQRKEDELRCKTKEVTLALFFMLFGVLHINATYVVHYYKVLIHSDFNASSIETQSLLYIILRLISCFLLIIGVTMLSSSKYKSICHKKLALRFEILMMLVCMLISFILWKPNIDLVDYFSMPTILLLLIYIIFTGYKLIIEYSSP
jgi:hypothetical protein